MLKRIKNYFEHYLNPEVPAADAGKKLQLAAAALFLEMMTMDDKIEAMEQETLKKLLQEKFSVPEEQADEFIELAEQERKDATDYFQFTSLINKYYSLEQKVQVIRLLWEIAYADGVLDSNEEYLVRKIADLLYVPHPAFIQAKSQVVDK